jgi:type II secretory pathway pseudopilin PulG
MIELLLTLTVLSIVGMIAVPALSRRSERADLELTLQSMAAVRTIVLNDYRSDMFESLPFPLDPGRVQHPQLKYLYDNPAAFTAANPDSIEATSAWTYDPVSSRGWSGPYIDHASGVLGTYGVNASAGFTENYGESGDPCPVDAWGRPIVLQQPVAAGSIHSNISVNYARVVSAGKDGVLQTPSDVLEPSSQQIGDDLVLYLRGR